MISQISIRNFRSIASADIESSWITTFVGANDAGKSNILRALNLFFNGETNPGEPFSFIRDFNQFADVRARKAPLRAIVTLLERQRGGSLADDQVAPLPPDPRGDPDSSARPSEGKSNNRPVRRPRSSSDIFEGNGRYRPSNHLQRLIVQEQQQRLQRGFAGS